ncbi:ABC-type Fe3+-siderophore transport system permease subunit [Geomicrobium halophilum]|uniref:ABC-type Fe3+-siderophore transport system permease subunit n=1 Tax=Geomicrobium halophilum TaxID=549000 RepID=A0A841PXG2_9BACL|nr:ABC-type Fe3+-siderophore transport system permease subunit [Geomicrobium halophilum]
MPRILLAALVGTALAVSGATLQGVMRNSLADAGIIGVTAGGGLAATIAMVAFPQLGFLLPPFAFIGACVTSLRLQSFPVFVMQTQTQNTARMFRTVFIPLIGSFPQNRTLFLVPHKRPPVTNGRPC